MLNQNMIFTLSLIYCGDCKICKNADRMTLNQILAYHACCSHNTSYVYICTVPMDDGCTLVFTLPMLCPGACNYAILNQTTTTILEDDLSSESSQNRAKI